MLHIRLRKCPQSKKSNSPAESHIETVRNPEWFLKFLEDKKGSNCFIFQRYIPVQYVIEQSLKMHLSAGTVFDYIIKAVMT